MFSIQIDIDVLAAARAVALSHTAKHDVFMLLKTVLTEAFGGAVVRPWSLYRQMGPVATVVGYGGTSITELEQRLGLALPSIRTGVKAVYGHPLPVVTAGQQFRFSVRLCPTIRVTRHGEMDAFLAAVRRGETNIERQGIYTRYLTARLHGADVEHVTMTRFKLEPMARPHRGATAPASGVAQRVVPDVVLEGIVTVTDPIVFAQTLMSGIGRQRAYGRGYVRLEPLRLAAAA
jgi:hypothetical protein